MHLFLPIQRQCHCSILLKSQESPATFTVVGERICSKIKYEEEMVPSEDALNRHWRRSCWVITVWGQCYPDLNGSGWKVSNGELSIDRDSDEKVRQMVSLIRKGCRCKTGCNSSRCKCKRQGKMHQLSCPRCMNQKRKVKLSQLI